MNNLTGAKTWEIPGQTVGSAITKQETDTKAFNKALCQAIKEAKKLQETIDTLYKLKREKNTYDSIILIESIIKSLES